MGWSRRSVLGAGLAAAASSGLGSRAPGGPPMPQGTDAGQANPASRPFAFEEMTIRIMDEGLVAGRFTSRQLTEAYLARIEEIDRKGPTLRAVLEINPDALEIADALDKERKEKGDRGPLHGIPILVKDNLDTADKMSCTAGSLALRSEDFAEHMRRSGFSPFGVQQADAHRAEEFAEQMNAEGPGVGQIVE